MYETLEHEGSGANVDRLAICTYLASTPGAARHQRSGRTSRICARSGETDRRHGLKSDSITTRMARAWIVVFDWPAPRALDRRMADRLPASASHQQKLVDTRDLRNCAMNALRHHRLQYPSGLSSDLPRCAKQTEPISSCHATSRKEPSNRGSN